MEVQSESCPDHNLLDPIHFHCILQSLLYESPSSEQSVESVVTVVVGIWILPEVCNKERKLVPFSKVMN